MKNKLILLALALLFCLKTQAQKDIVVDFSTKQVPDLKTLQNMNDGDCYRIIIRHLNMNLYKVSLTARDTIFQSSALSTPTLPTFFGGVDAVKGLISNITTSGAGFNTPLDKLLGNDKLKMRVESYSDVYDAVGSSIKSYQSKHKDTLGRYATDLNALKNNTDGILYNIFLYQLKGKVEANSGNDYSTINSSVTGMTDADGNKSIDIVTTLTDIRRERTALTLLRNRMLIQQAAYTSYADLAKNKALIEADADLKQNDGLIKASYTQLLAFATSLDSATSAGKIGDLLNTVIMQKNNESYTYTSLPIMFKNDQAIVNLNITPLNNEPRLQTYTMPLFFPTYRKAYVAVGASFYGANLFNEAYSQISVKRDTITGDSLVKEKNTNGEMGIATLIRFGVKVYHNKVGVHASFGPGISLSNTVRPRVLFGGGVSLGKKHMFSMDFGGIAGYVDRLSVATKTETLYTSLPATVTVSQLKVGFFISVGYLYRFGS